MRALEDDQDYFVVPIVARGAEKIYAQLGNEVGDSCLDKFAERLRVLSSNGDSVFRWRGVTFLAILRRSATISEVRREIYGVINAQHDQSIQIGGRTLWLPISATWDAIAVTSPLSYLLLKIDQFITS
jgi:GGDEF domain-containing protein